MSKLAEVVAEKESAGNSAIDDLLMMGIEADIASLQDMYKKGYLKIPEFFFAGAPSEKTVLIQSVLSFFEISDEQKQALQASLEKFSSEQLKNKMRQLREKVRKVKARTARSRRSRQSHRTRKN